MEQLTIGALARLAGVSVDTVRFYEKRGVLPAPARRRSGYRVYTRATADRLRLVKTLQALGLNLDEVIEALRNVDDGKATCASGRPQLARVLARIDAQLEVLLCARGKLARVLETCSSGHCPGLDEGLGHRS